MPAIKSVKSKTAGRKNCVKKSVHTVSTQNCTVSLTDIFSDIPNRLNILELEAAKMKSELDSLRLKQSHENPTNKLLKILNDPFDDSLSDEDLKQGSLLLKSLADELNRRLLTSHQLVIYNIPDSILLSSIKYLLSRETKIQICDITRLRKKSIKHNCPLLVTFSSISDANIFISLEQKLRLIQNFETIVIRKAHPPLERATNTNKSDRPIKQQDLNNKPVMISPAIAECSMTTINAIKSIAKANDTNNETPIEKNRNPSYFKKFCKYPSKISKLL
ncbi:hypothetical protein [Cetobacterium sp.]|uniref:hypothetical protein n=1 Tax=Cetobacterium sp. TaxID=2071632 RepID=UPI003EE6DE8A